MLKQKMKKTITACFKKILSSNVSVDNTTDNQNGVDVREEYANAFRTESYNHFWARVLSLTSTNSTTCIPRESTTAARLPSYRLFAENLLDPDQPTVTRILAFIHTSNSTRALLTEYFIETANASFLCGLLLKDIDRVRVKHRSLKATLQLLEASPIGRKSHVSVIMTRLKEFTQKPNPLERSGSSSTQVRLIQANCAQLLKQLESNRDKAKRKLRLKSKIKHSSTLLLATLTVSLTIIIATHALALLVATPSLLASSFKLASSQKLEKITAQLDAAAKGTYILSRDLDTISRFMDRITFDLEHVNGIVKYWLDRGEDLLQANDEVARQLKKYNCDFSEQLDELEEHLYLCFMTINRARNLVVKEILDPGQPTKAPNILL